MSHPMITPFLVFFISAAALAGHEGEKKDTAGTPSMQRVDTDQDGFIERDEARLQPSVLSIFDALDTNHDGKVSEAEYRPGKDSDD